MVHDWSQQTPRGGPTPYPISVCAPSIFTQERSQLPPPYRCVYHLGGRFSLAHKNPGVHGADLLSFSGALCHPLPLLSHTKLLFCCCFVVVQHNNFGSPIANMRKLINVYLSITIQTDFGVCILYTTFHYTAFILKTNG